MLRRRVIPCLLIQAGRLVKTVGFRDPKYIGDPLNAVRIFNEKQVDELLVADIDASVAKRAPDLRLIKALASECRMPLCYVGGVKTAEQVERIVALGVEKVGISSGALCDGSLVSSAARRVGSQSLVGIVDVRKDRDGCYLAFTHNGCVAVGKSLEQCVSEFQETGVGEVIVNSIDRDGTLAGYDPQLVALACGITKVPLTILGGAGSVGDIRELLRREGVSGAAAGSVFVFKGRLRAVLITYLSQADRDGTY